MFLSVKTIWHVGKIIFGVSQLTKKLAAQLAVPWAVNGLHVWHLPCKWGCPLLLYMKIVGSSVGSPLNCPPLKLKHSQALIHIHFEAHGLIKKFWNESYFVKLVYLEWINHYPSIREIYPRQNKRIHMTGRWRLHTLTLITCHHILRTGEITGTHCKVMVNPSLTLFICFESVQQCCSYDK